MARRSPGGLVLRVVYVPGGAGAADARRRVVDVLLQAASSTAGGAAPTPSANESVASPGEKAA